MPRCLKARIIPAQNNIMAGQCRMSRVQVMRPTSLAGGDSNRFSVSHLQRLPERS